MFLSSLFPNFNTFLNEISPYYAFELLKELVNSWSKCS